MRTVPLWARQALSAPRVAGTHFHREDEPKTTMDISKRLVDLDLTRDNSCNAVQGLGHLF